MTGEYIYSYTREQAIEDGVLIAIDPKITEKMGFKVPISITESVYYQYIYWEEIDNERQTYQDQSGRLNDVLWMCFLYLNAAIKKGIQNSGNGILFPVSVIPRKEGSRAKRAKKIFLKIFLGPGDNLEPVLTILLPEED